MFVIFPHQLWEDISHVPPNENIYLIEEPMFFYDSIHRPILPHKLKIAYMVACMHVYHDYLRHKFTPRCVHYIAFDDVPAFYKAMQKATHVSFCDPVDHDVMKKYTQLQPRVHVLPTKMFLLSSVDLWEYHARNSTSRSTHAMFYKYVRGKLHVLQDVPNMDRENRNALPKTWKGTSPPGLYSHPVYKKACVYVEQHPVFSKAVGSLENIRIWPITFEHALHALRTFLSNRLEQYGTYQDAIHKDHVFLYHAGMSPVLNIGLLSPHQVLQHVLMHRGKTAMRNVEGFVRQLIGWREYMRYLYVCHQEVLESNHFGHQRTFQDRDAWLNGTTQLPIVDHEIHKILQFGYAHHIVRLMVFLNLFHLMEIHPHHVYAWFMQMIAMDAYDWVMKSNIYAMGWHYPKAMVKPYLSTSNYLLKMSNYPKGPWCNVWDALFYRFLQTHTPHLVRGAQVYLRNLAAWDRKPKSEQKEMSQEAQTFLRHATTSLTKSRSKAPRR